MAEEPSNGELSRLIQLMRGDIRDDMAQINSRLDRMVSTEVYQVEKVGVARTISDLTALVEAERAERLRDKEAQALQRVQDQEKIAQFRRWLIASVIIPLVGLIIPFVFFIMGGKS